MNEHLRQPTTIAILGADPVVENALAMLLEGVGYSTRILEDPSETNVGKQLLLEGVDVVLLTFSLNEEHKDGFLKAIEATAPAAAGDVPVVLTLSTPPQKELNGRAGNNLVPWPTPLENLRRAVETALAPALAVPAEGAG